MAKKRREQEKWLISTFVALMSFFLGYFFFLFPHEATRLVILYLNYLVGGLIVILAIATAVLLYRKQLKNNSSNKIEERVSLEKMVSQIIWRNRYVLQSKKSQLLYDSTSENIELWINIKKTFAYEYIFVKIPESRVSFNKVSELIEQSLQGTAINGSGPPTY